MSRYPYERMSVYRPGLFSSDNSSNDSLFRLESGNQHFQSSWLTWASFIVLILLYPGINMAGGGGKSVGAMLKTLGENQGALIFMLIATILIQWSIFTMNYVTVFIEKTGLRGLGFGKLRLVHFAWAVPFLLLANLILAGVAWFLGQIGLPMSGEIGLLIPTDPFGKVVWVFVSITAGVCEETAFRGYLMSRLRLVFKTRSWLIPTLVSALVFGACHTYQGLSGFIVITIYGALFSLLYIRTGSIWPAIIAHSMQDLGALFWPQ